MFVIVVDMTLDAGAPVSRRERPAKPALTREGIVAAAVEVMRTEGLERVTMRRLAQELDTGAASLYVYVDNREDLIAAVLDELLGAVDLGPATAPGDWRDRIVQVLCSYTLVLFEHPSLARSALLARPSGPNYVGLVESLLALLSEGDPRRRRRRAGEGRARGGAAIRVAADPPAHHRRRHRTSVRYRH